MYGSLWLRWHLARGQPPPSFVGSLLYVRPQKINAMVFLMI